MLTRRRFLIGSLATGAISCTSRYVRTSAPHVTHGVQIGDVGGGRALVWARCDEPARLVVDWDTTDRFHAPHRLASPVVSADTDFAAKVLLAGLPENSSIFVRARFEREAERGESAWETAQFRTPRPTDVRFVWTGDVCGQGYGRNPEWGGLRGFATMLAADPDFFLHSGDLIYADNPILPELTLPDGRIWKNVSNERVARVAQTLDDFRARFRYNLEDEHVRALAARVPIVAQWDDHETHNNWWPDEQLDDDRYTIERDTTTLSGYARRAMLEWTAAPAGPVHRIVSYGPLVDVIVLDCRTFRSPNSPDTGDDAMLGAPQAAWLADALRNSRATWKIVACDQPLALVIPDGPHDERREGWANGVPGAPTGRERELAGVLAQTRDVPNVCWFTADVHYAAAHYFRPDALAPFWEFVAGPIHAGTFGPNPLDPTFGPELKFQWAPAPGQANLAPWDGLQSFGVVHATADALQVSLRGIDGKDRYSVAIDRV
ncbi:MAG TPA: alkaline phosphatase D family protein [Kofleriaceae bacterium]